MSRRVITWSGILIAIAVAAVLLDRTILPKPVAVAVWEMKRMDLQETVTGVAAGYAEPAKRVSVYPDVSVRVNEVQAKRGDRVNRGVALSALRKTRVQAPFGGLVLDSNLEVGQLWTGLSMVSLAGASPSAGFGRPETAGIASETSTLFSQAQPPLSSQGHLELADDSEMFVVIDVDENDYGKLKTGQTVLLTMEALGERKATGSVVEKDREN